MARIDAMLHRALSQVLRQTLNDPFVNKSQLVITSVLTSKDLSHATCYFSSLAPSTAHVQIQQYMNQRTAGFIRKELARLVPHIARVPAIRFVPDRSQVLSAGVEMQLARWRMEQQETAETKARPVGN